MLYNDAWSPIPGEKHPWALGRPAREVWPEIWDTIGPLFEEVVTTGRATRRQDQLLPMRRHGFTEECYFDYTFSPVRGESGTVDGVFNAVVETTTRVVGERRLRTLRELAAGTTGEAKSAEDACRA
ncbi:MAG TPA: PAS domain-containing protein, partial [Planctomycetaceae bacterium]